MSAEEDWDRFRERFVRSFLDWVMLSIIQRRPTYGYEMITIIGDEYGVYISPGSLYPILYNLEGAGFIAGTWEDPTKKSRKLYALTEEGDRALRTGLDTVDRLLGTLRGNSTAGRREEPVEARKDT